MADALPGPLAAKLEELACQHAGLAAELEDPATLADHNAVRELSIKKAALEQVVTGYRAYSGLLEEAAELREALASGDDAELAEMAREEIPRLEAEAAARIEAVKAALVQ
ncbi:MAG: PCRF domain-containing protein, partial [Planctomycetota bacterium]